MSLPWNEKINVLQINPQAATLQDIARMATELSELRKDAPMNAEEYVAGELGPSMKYGVCEKSNCNVPLCKAYRLAVHLAEENMKLKEQYHELLFAVAQKFPNESRHETALRYIRERETIGDNTAQEANAHATPKG